jgi:hypothetical protein
LECLPWFKLAGCRFYEKTEGARVEIYKFRQEAAKNSSNPFFSTSLKPWPFAALFQTGSAKVFLKASASQISVDVGLRALYKGL